MRRLSILIAVTALIAFAVPVSAFAAPGYATANVHMRAGPGIGYPIVTTIPERAHVEIYGCLVDRDWCDVMWDGYRGWVLAHYLEYFYGGHYVYLPNYFDVVQVPIVTFVLGTYWDQHYRGRPWFHRRNYWEGYWQTHHRPGVRPPSVKTPKPHPLPSIKRPKHRTPSTTVPLRPAPSGTMQQRRAPSTRSGTPQHKLQQLQAAPPATSRPSIKTPKPQPLPSLKTPTRRIPSTGVSPRPAPSGTIQQRRAPSTRSGTSQHKPRQLQAPPRTTAPSHPAPRPRSGANIQRTAPRSGTKAPAGQQQRQKKPQ